MYRMFLCKTLPRDPRSEDTSKTSPARASSCAGRPRNAPADDMIDGLIKQKAGLGYCNITKCCTPRLPGAYSHHR